MMMPRCKVPSINRRKTMALEQHLEMLKKRHTELDLRILAEHARPSPDARVLNQLKRQKLILKDDINRLSYVEDAA